MMCKYFVDFAFRRGAKNIYLMGHTTGCQKAIYWARQNSDVLTGIILLAPISDYAAATRLCGATNIARATKVANKLVAKRQRHCLLPHGVWHEELDAQRFLSLYAPDSIEEIFSYSQPRKIPRALKSISCPTLVLLLAKTMSLMIDQLTRLRDGLTA